jgi:queuosine biosynthesis protein QueC
MKVICLSGGLDSAVALLGEARVMRRRWDGKTTADPFDLALTFDYGQPRAGRREPPEVSVATTMADRAGVPHEVITIEWGEYMPETGLLGGHVETPAASVVPGRNSLFIAAAAMRGATSVTLGCNADDQADFPDCREAVLKAVGVACGVEVLLPMVGRTKAQIVELAKDCALHIDDTVTCYRGTGCGECAACRLLKSALRIAKLVDDGV